MNLRSEIKKNRYLFQISELAKSVKIDIFIVGGFVRDLILKREVKEIDFLVVGDGPKFAELAAERLNIKKVNIFKNFGTAQFKVEDFSFEFVGSRKESYTKDSRNPEVSKGDFKDDISRRDFTINTLAVSLNENNFGDIIDLFDGYADLEKRIIRTPLNPIDTFDDDPLRILRAYRFASQLGFQVDESINIASSKLADRLEIISQERITDELLKILSSNRPSIGLKLLHDSGVMKFVFPEISNLSGIEQRKDYHHKDVFLHTCEVVDNISEVSEDIWLRFAALVHDIAKPNTKKFIDGTGWTFHGHEEVGARMMKQVFKKLKLPMNKLLYVEKLVRLHLRPISLVSENVTDSAIRRLSAAAGEDLDDLIALCRADITSKNPQKVSRYLKNYEIVMQKVKDVQEKDNLRAFQSPVDGQEIMRIFNIKPSKKVGEIKSAIEEAILEGIIPNNHDAAMKYLLTIKDNFFD